MKTEVSLLQAVTPKRKMNKETCMAVSDHFQRKDFNFVSSQSIARPQST